MTIILKVMSHGKIYTSPEPTEALPKPVGPAYTQFRDCEDIAIKIAAWFNRPDLSISPCLSFESKDFSVIDLPILQALTNLDDTNKSLISYYKKTPLRLKQCTNLDRILEIARCEKVLKIQKEMLKAMKRDELCAAADKLHKKTLKKPELKEFSSVEACTNFIKELDDIRKLNIGTLISDPLFNPDSLLIGDGAMSGDGSYGGT
jgi:hypothetical protein